MTLQPARLSTPQNSRCGRRPMSRLCAGHRDVLHAPRLVITEGCRTTVRLYRSGEGLGWS